MIEEILVLHKVITGSSKRKERQLLEEIADLSQISDIESRVSGHQAVFYDTFGKSKNEKSKGRMDKSFGIIRQDEKCTEGNSDKSVMSGTTALVVETNNDYFGGMVNAGEEVTIYDDENHEDVIVASCEATTLNKTTEEKSADGKISINMVCVPNGEHHITLASPLKHDYKQNAVLCRSNVKIDEKLNIVTFNTWKDKEGVEHDLKFGVMRYNMFPQLDLANEIIVWLEHMSQNTCQNSSITIR